VSEFTSGSLDDLGVIALVGTVPQSLAVMAERIADEAAGDRRVAIFDLAGAFPAERGEGLIAAFRDGRSLSALARPFGPADREWFVVGRGPERDDDTIARHPRWAKLIAGFRSTGALLILLIPRSLPDSDWLTDQVDRVIAAPVVAVPPPPAPTPPAARPRGRLALLLLILLLLAATVIWQVVPRPQQPTAAETEAIADADARRALVAAPPPAPQAIAPDTIVVPDVANPADSAAAAQWGVILFATNDRTDANLRLGSAGADLSAGSIAPIVVGADGTPLYRVVAGAYTDRADAEALRTRLRESGSLPPTAGLVERMPYAIQLETALSIADARQRTRAWMARGIAAYALMDVERGVSVYTGAFETPEQSALLLAALRDEAPGALLAFRVGRSF
jgi:hypothetical protein